MAKYHYIFAGLALAGLTACAAPGPVAIGPEPVADKYGNALYCPDPYVLQGDVCVLPTGAVVTGSGTAPAAPAPGTGTGSTGNQNGNQNANQEQSGNQNQEQSGNQNSNQAQNG